MSKFFHVFLFPLNHFYLRKSPYLSRTKPETFMSKAETFHKQSRNISRTKPEPFMSEPQSGKRKNPNCMSVGYALLQFGLLLSFYRIYQTPFLSTIGTTISSRVLSA